MTLLSQAAACDGIIYQINNGYPCQEPEANFLPLFQDLYFYDNADNVILRRNPTGQRQG